MKSHYSLLILISVKQSYSNNHSVNYIPEKGYLSECLYVFEIKGVNIGSNIVAQNKSYLVTPQTSRPYGALLIHSFSTKNGMIRLHGVFSDP